MTSTSAGHTQSSSSNWIARVIDAVRNALRVRAEVSKLMGQAQLRRR